MAKEINFLTFAIFCDSMSGKKIFSKFFGNFSLIQPFFCLHFINLTKNNIEKLNLHG